MPSHFDTIVAPITPPGRGAVAAIRISGPAAWAISRHAFPSLPEEPQPRFAYYGTFSNGDDGLAVLFMEGKSYTGEESAEFFVHGSSISVEQLIDFCIQSGARFAVPGEFTQRAFLNGRIDLTQAEAVAETVDAQSELGLRAAHRQRLGGLKKDLDLARFAIDEAAIMLEAQIDFAEDVGPLDLSLFQSLIATASRELARVQANAIGSEQARNGYRVVLLGKPNSGKSSLFNRMLGNERAIVTPIAGTTRDTLEYPLNLSGLTVLLVDTAGLRSNPDEIEALGIERSLAASVDADLVLYLTDLTQVLEDNEHKFLDELQNPYLLVGTKSDLAPACSGLAISAKNGDGLDKLNEAIKMSLLTAMKELPYLLNSRHALALSTAASALEEASNASDARLSADLVLSPLLDARAALASIVGESISEDLLHAVFSKFCIGK